MEDIFLAMVLLQYLQEMQLRSSPWYLMYQGMLAMAYSQFIPSMLSAWVEYMSSQSILSMLNMIYAKLQEIESKVDCIETILAGDNVSNYCGGGSDDS